MRLSLTGLSTLIVALGVALFAALGAYTYYQVQSLNTRLPSSSPSRRRRKSHNRWPAS